MPGSWVGFGNRGPFWAVCRRLPALAHYVEFDSTSCASRRGNRGQAPDDRIQLLGRNHIQDGGIHVASSASDHTRGGEPCRHNGRVGVDNDSRLLQQVHRKCEHCQCRGEVSDERTCGVMEHEGTSGSGGAQRSGRSARCDRKDGSQRSCRAEERDRRHGPTGSTGPQGLEGAQSPQGPSGTAGIFGSSGLISSVGGGTGADWTLGSIQANILPSYGTNYAPADGSALLILNCPALYALIGTTFGGDARRPSACRICARRLRSGLSTLSA